MKKIILSFLVILAIGLSCKDEIAKPKLEPTINLFFEDASCTEVWLKLVVLNVTNPRVEIKRSPASGVAGSDSLIATYTLTTPDTTIIDEGLLPNSTYTYTAQLLLPAAGGNGSVAYNSTTQARTMDTTSHDFTWQTYTLGDGSGSSCLYDVAIINDTLAYAVGEIYQDYYKDYQIYNAGKWNGKTWELMRIQSLVCGSNGVYTIRKLSTIFAFNENDVWFSDGGEIIHWNGGNYTNDCSMNSWLTGAINKLWGSPSAGLYAVGNNGLIAHRGTDGVWRKIESGTNLQFLDIYGSGNEILAVCTQNYPPGKGVFSIQANIAKEISSNIPSYQIAELFGVWFTPSRHYYIVGDGIYEKYFLSESKWKNGPLDITHYATTKIRGTGLNNIFVVGAYGECLHWNGVRWKSYRNITALSYGSYSGLDIRNNYLIAVGSDNARAVITVGMKY